MANALLLRRRAAAVSSWTPKSLGANLIGWWRADDVAALGNGASVASWTDRSGNGHTVTQGTGSAQPTVVTSAINGKPAVAFASASSQFLSQTSPAGIPNSGPLFAFWIGFAGNSGNQSFVSYNDSVRCAWGAFAGGGQLTWFEGGIGSNATGGGATGTNLYIAGMGGAGDGNKVYGTHNNIQPGFPSNGTLAAPNTVGAGANFAIGALNAGGSTLNGQIAEMFLMNAKPTAAQLKSLAGYVMDRYNILCGRGYSAATATTIGVGNYDGSNNINEIDAYYDASATFGHAYWFAYVPPPGSVPTHENPSVVYADAPTGPYTAPQANPIIAARATGTNADPHIRLQHDGVWYLFYSVGNDGTPANNGTFALTTTDPRTVAWSAPSRLLPSPTALESVVVWDGTGYVMFSDSTTGHLLSSWGRSANPLGPWTTETICTIPIPGGRTFAQAGEFDIRLSVDGSKFVLAFHDNDGSSSACNIWFATSPVTDGLTWRVNKYPTLIPNSFGWDSAALYRPSFAYDSVAGNYKVWYSTSAATGFGYTTVDKAEVEGG